MKDETNKQLTIKNEIDLEIAEKNLASMFKYLATTGIPMKEIHALAVKTLFKTFNVEYEEGETK